MAASSSQGLALHTPCGSLAHRLVLFGRAFRAEKEKPEGPCCIWRHICASGHTECIEPTLESIGGTLMYYSMLGHLEDVERTPIAQVCPAPEALFSLVAFPLPVLEEIIQGPWISFAVYRVPTLGACYIRSLSPDPNVNTTQMKQVSTLQN